MSEASKKKRDLIPYSERAGYRLNNSATYPMMMKAPNGQAVAMGFIDSSQSLYQGGGELGEIIYLPSMLMSLPYELWENLLRSGVKTWEMIDHDSNTSYRIGMELALRHGHEYNTKNGKRWGVPVRYVQHVNNSGKPIELSNKSVGPADPRQKVMEFD